jgi:DNA (cytosine-5)-methyltransferase 1
MDERVGQRPKALDLFCRAGGVSEGLRRAGFDVTGVDVLDCQDAYERGPGNPVHPNPARFIQADALTFPLDGYDFIWASPPCQAHTSLRHLQAGKEYPDLIPAIRERLVGADTLGYVIENVPGAPLGEAQTLIMLCGTMFGLQTPDGRAELRRHRLFELTWKIPHQPPCRHGVFGDESLSVTGTGMGPGNKGKHAQRSTISVTGAKGVPGVSHRRRALAVAGHGARAWNPRRTISVTGNTAQTNVVRNTVRETFSVGDARHAMGIDWMPMRHLSQAIPPAYAEYLGNSFLGIVMAPATILSFKREAA